MPADPVTLLVLDQEPETGTVYDRPAPPAEVLAPPAVTDLRRHAEAMTTSVLGTCAEQDGCPLGFDACRFDACPAVAHRLAYPPPPESP